jgi:hypothetical protein
MPKARVVVGIDPGLFSAGFAMLSNGHLAQVWQQEIPRSKRKDGDHSARFETVLTAHCVDVKPDVVGLEVEEPQPWRANGRHTKGAVARSKHVLNLHSRIAEAGFIVYAQSPGIQKNYPDVVIDSMVKKAFGDDFPITPHLRSAIKHALYADSRFTQRRVRGSSDNQ